MPESWNMRLIGHTDLDGHGDAMHVNLKDGYAFIGHMGESGTSVVDMRDPRTPRVVARIPASANTHSHKVQVLGDIMLVNRERIPRSHGPWQAGLAIYDVSVPTKPVQIGWWQCGGKGVHRMTFWEQPYAYVTGGADDYQEQFFIILDLSDPTKPREAGRWWYPGQRIGTGERSELGEDWLVKLHHATIRGNRAYCGWWDRGVVILDISDPSSPAMVSQLSLPHEVSRSTHTALSIPGRDLLVTTEERIADGCDGVAPNARLIDIRDESNPNVITTLPTPEGDFCSRGGRFGPHNVHEVRPGYLSDVNTIYMTYFSAGLRVYDISHPAQPVEIAYYIPDAPRGQPSIQLNDVIVDEQGLIYTTDRIGGGLYVLELSPTASAARPRR